MQTCAHPSGQAAEKLTAAMVDEAGRDEQVKHMTAMVTHHTHLVPITSNMPSVATSAVEKLTLMCFVERLTSIAGACVPVGLDDLCALLGKWTGPCRGGAALVSASTLVAGLRRLAAFQAAELAPDFATACEMLRDVRCMCVP